MQPEYMGRGTLASSPRNLDNGCQPAGTCVIATGSPAGGDVTMHTPETASLLERFLNSPEAAKKKANSMQRKLADMLSPLLVGRSGKAPSPRSAQQEPGHSGPSTPAHGSPMQPQGHGQPGLGMSPRTAALAAQSPAPMMISPRVPPASIQSTASANMQAADATAHMDVCDGARSKKSSAESNMSSASTATSMGVHGQGVVAAPAVTPLAAPAVPSSAQAAPSPPALLTPQLERLLRAARHCALPASPRAEPPPGSPAGTPNQTTLLALSHTLPPRMVRSHWCMDDYIMGDKLYTGYASTVYKAQCKRSGDTVVLKIYTLAAVCDLYKYQIYREVRVHASLDHEHVVKLYAAFQEGDRIILVQEYADGADLFTLLHKYGGRLSERLAVQVVLDPFLRVLHYLHSRGIIHRDIKPENILFTKNMVLKLGDFGLAIDLREERAVTRAGTLDYMAPEVLRCPFKSRPEENKDNPGLHYSSRVDSWAVGVLTFELLSGFPPFFDQSRTNTEQHINTKQPEFPATVSAEARSFIGRALAKSSEQRPTIYDMLIHSWVDQYRGRRSVRAPAASAPEPQRTASAAPVLLMAPSDGAVSVATNPPSVMQVASSKVAAQGPPRVLLNAQSALPGSLHMPAPQMQVSGRPAPVLAVPQASVMRDSPDMLPAMSLGPVPAHFASPFAAGSAGLAKQHLSHHAHHPAPPSRMAGPMLQMPGPAATYAVPPHARGDAAVYVGAYGKAAPPSAQVMARLVGPSDSVPKPHQQQLYTPTPTVQHQA